MCLRKYSLVLLILAFVVAVTTPAFVGVRVASVVFDNQMQSCLLHEGSDTNSRSKFGPVPMNKSLSCEQLVEKDALWFHSVIVVLVYAISAVLFYGLYRLAVLWCKRSDSRYSYGA
jgi:hypothetical protein